MDQIRGIFGRAPRVFGAGAVRVAAMPQVPVIVTHLAANRENQHRRIQELSVLLPWAARHGPGLRRRRGLVGRRGRVVRLSLRRPIRMAMAFANLTAQTQILVFCAM